LIDAVLEMKRRNPTWGCPRIAQQITLALGVDLDKDTVRRILGTHYGLDSGSGGPSWLTFLGQAKDSLWSIDLFRCETLSLRTHWVLLVMDQFTRRIIGFGIHRGTVDGPSLCSMFRRAIQGQALPKYLSTDNDPLYRFHRWQANLRVLEVMEIKTVPHVPLSHPFVERLVGTLRRECLDRTLFWTTADLEAKLREFQKYFNEHWTHAGVADKLCLVSLAEALCTWHWRKTPPNPGRSSRQRVAGSSRYQCWAACTIDTSGAPPEQSNNRRISEQVPLVS
jgi:transposase InsO family protein